MSELVRFAEEELNVLLKGCKDEEAVNTQKLINNQILDIVKMFSEQGHSGFSASYAISLLSKLLKYQPLTPLTGEDDEWTKLDYTPDICYQNKRCSSVFKDEDGKAYNIDAKVFSDDNGHTWYTGKDSKEYITFPYIVKDPEKIIIDNVDERSNILSQIVKALEEIDIKINILDIDENTYIFESYNQDKINEIEAKLTEYFNISKPICKLDNEQQVWGLISWVMKSDKK